MLNVRSIIGNFSVALAAQGINMVVGIVTSLLVPKVLGVEEFGYWQLFIFYISYVGFFHLGLNDGVYLVHGGESRSEINKSSIISQFWVGMAYQVLCALAIVVGALLFVDDGNRLFVILITGLFLLLNNAVGYLGCVMQAMDETRLYSASVAIHSLFFLLPLCMLLVLQVTDFRTYVGFYTVGKIAALVYCIVKSRDFFVAPKLPMRQAVREAWASIGVGIKLMIANTAALLVMGVARFLIDGHWGIETFSMVSFALSMVTFFMLFISQASMVLFPALRKASSQESAHFFEASRDCLDLVLPVCYILYFPAVWLLSLWLPAYQPSLTFFAFLLPMCIFDGKMSIVGTTFLKVLRMEAMLLVVNVATMVASAVGALVGTYLLHSVEFTIVVPVCAIAVRTMVTDRYVESTFGIGHSHVFAGGMVLAVAFVVVAILAPTWWGFAIVCACYGVFVGIFRRRMREVIRELRSLGSSFAS